MENIDAVFDGVVPGLANYRKENDKGDVVIDQRFRYHVSENINTSLIIKNLLNEENMGRPGDMRPPRQLVLQLNINI